MEKEKNEQRVSCEDEMFEVQKEEAIPSDNAEAELFVENEMKERLLLAHVSGNPLLGRAIIDAFASDNTIGVETLQDLDLT